MQQRIHPAKRILGVELLSQQRPQVLAAPRGQAAARRGWLLQPLHERLLVLARQALRLATAGAVAQPLDALAVMAAYPVVEHALAERIAPGRLRHRVAPRQVQHRQHACAHPPVWLMARCCLQRLRVLASGRSHYIARHRSLRHSSPQLLTAELRKLLEIRIPSRQSRLVRLASPSMRRHYRSSHRTGARKRAFGLAPGVGPACRYRPRGETDQTVLARRRRCCTRRARRHPTGQGGDASGRRPTVGSHGK